MHLNIDEASLLQKRLEALAGRPGTSDLAHGLRKRFEKYLDGVIVGKSIVVAEDNGFWSRISIGLNVVGCRRRSLHPSSPSCTYPPGLVTL